MDRKQSRMRAYGYIVKVVKTRVNSIPPIDSDEGLADSMDVPIAEIENLKMGRSDPSEKMVSWFVDITEKLVPKSEIENYLINPFR